MQWPYAKEKLNTGTLLSVAWSLDGTQLAGAGGNGTVIFGQLVDKYDYNPTVLCPGMLPKESF
jgi:hypothetical protein